jgi:hypothetical protein
MIDGAQTSYATLRTANRIDLVAMHRTVYCEETKTMQTKDRVNTFRDYCSKGRGGIRYAVKCKRGFIVLVTEVLWCIGSMRAKCAKQAASSWCLSKHSERLNNWRLNGALRTQNTVKFQRQKLKNKSQMTVNNDLTARTERKNAVTSSLRRWPTRQSARSQVHKMSINSRLCTQCTLTTSTFSPRAQYT